MANLTLAVDAELLKKARIRALEEGTSVNAVVRDFLWGYANPAAAEQAMARFVQRARAAAGGGSGSEGRTWTRDELHERAGLR